MNWEKVKLGDVLIYEQPTRYIVESEDYDDSFSIPVLTAGKTFILGYTDETEGIYSNLPAIIFDDFTTESKFVTFPFKVKSSAMKILTCNPSIADIRYMFYLLKNLKVLTDQHKRYWISKFANIEIPLPPLHIQEQIADTLDKANAVRRKDQELLQKYDELAQAIFYDMFGDPVRNEKGWKTYKLKEICTQITDGTHFSPPSVDIGVPYITAKHLKKWGLDFFSNPTYVDQEHHEEIYARCKPLKGDVLYIKDVATTGLAAINEYDFEFSMLSSLALIKPNTSILNNYFLTYWLNNDRVKNQLVTEFMAGAAIQRFTLSKINQFSIYLPPIKLQEDFSKKIIRLKESNSQHKVASTMSHELFYSLITTYFSN